MRRSIRLRAPAPAAWPRSVRLACAAAGLALLAALCFGTRREVLAVYARRASVEARTPLHLPALPPPAFAADSIDGIDVTTSQRFLVQVFVARRDFGLDQKPFLLWEWQHKWPDDKDKRLWCVVAEEGGTNLQLLTVERVYFDEGLKADWDVQTLRGPAPAWRAGASSSYFCHWSRPQDAQAYVEFNVDLGLDRRTTVRPPLSLVPRRTPDQLVLGLSVFRVALDDPLRESSQEEVLGTLRGKYAPSYSDGSENTRRTSVGGGALRHAYRTGLAVLPLLAVPLFLAQLARRRELAFLALLAPTALLGVGCDRWALGVHLGRLADPAAPLEERALALDSLETSFFYRDTALVAASRIAQDSAQPELLRQKASAVASRIRSS